MCDFGFAHKSQTNAFGAKNAQLNLAKGIKNYD